MTTNVHYYGAFVYFIALASRVIDLYKVDRKLTIGRNPLKFLGGLNRLKQGNFHKSNYKMLKKVKILGDY